MVTIKDIANITGVSPTTVANVIHGRTNKVSKENVERIQKPLCPEAGPGDNDQGKDQADRCGDSYNKSL